MVAVNFDVEFATVATWLRAKMKCHWKGCLGPAGNRFHFDRLIGAVSLKSLDAVIDGNERVEPRVLL